MRTTRRHVFALSALAIAGIFLLVQGDSTRAQVQLLDKQELRSGGAIQAVPGATTPGPGSRTGSGPPPRVGPNVQANASQVGTPFGRSETTIASNNGGTHMVAGWNDAEGFLNPPFGPGSGAPGLSGYAYSTDGGLTWTDGGAPPDFDGVITRGDPWLTQGGPGNNTVYYANLAVDAVGNSLGVGVHRGRFDGNVFVWDDVRTFDSPHNQDVCDFFGDPAACDFYDKEAIAGGSNGSGAAYVSVTNFQELCGVAQFGFGQIEVWRTHDGGNTWQGPAIAGPEAPDSVASCGFEGTLQQSSVPAVGPGGEVYVVWQFGPTFDAVGNASTDADIVVARSLDGGVTFQPFVKVADINSMRQNAPVGYNRGRINDHPRIAVADSGPNRGRVYVVFYSAVSPVAVGQTVQSLVSSQVYVSYSDNKGLTWSTPKAVAPAPPASGVKRFWPVVSLQPGGNVDVIYYESLETQATPAPADEECNISLGPGVRRRGPNSSLVDTFWSRSINGTASFEPPIKMSTATSNWCTTATSIRPNFGDYIGATSGGNRVLAVWADGRNGVPDTYYAQGQSAGKAR